MNFEIDDVVLRAARPEDMVTLRQFEQGVILAERPFDPTVKAETTYYDLDFMLTADNVKLLVATWNSQIIGSGYARIEQSKHFLVFTHHVYLGFMFVLPAFRGKGVNARIIDNLKGWARDKGITEMRLDVYYPNDSAIRAYEKFGFSRHMIEMRCPI